MSIISILKNVTLRNHSTCTDIVYPPEIVNTLIQLYIRKSSNKHSNYRRRHRHRHRHRRRRCWRPLR